PFFARVQKRGKNPFIVDGIEESELTPIVWVVLEAQPIELRGNPAYRCSIVKGDEQADLGMLKIGILQWIKVLPALKVERRDPIWITCKNPKRNSQKDIAVRRADYRSDYQ